MKIRGTLALDQVIAAAEQIDDPNPTKMMDLYDRQVAAGEITPVEYVIWQTALGLALLAQGEVE